MDCTARGKGNERVEAVVWVHQTVVMTTRRRMEVRQEAREECNRGEERSMVFLYINKIEKKRDVRAERCTRSSGASKDGVRKCYKTNLRQAG